VDTLTTYFLINLNLMDFLFCSKHYKGLAIVSSFIINSILVSFKFELEERIAFYFLIIFLPVFNSIRASSDTIMISIQTYIHPKSVIVPK